MQATVILSKVPYEGEICVVSVHTFWNAEFEQYATHTNAVKKSQWHHSDSTHIPKWRSIIFCASETQNAIIDFQCWSQLDA